MVTAQKMKFLIHGFFNKCDQIRSFLQIWSYLLKKSLMEKFIFYTVLSESNLIRIILIKKNGLSQVYGEF